MISGGVMHFVVPAFYVALVPPFLPVPFALVIASGVVEIAVGVMLVIPAVSRWGAWGIIATLIAVYPANIYHAVSGGLDHPDLPAAMSSAAIAWGRLPLQLVLIAWAYWYTRPVAAGVTDSGR
jgi:uncharacterized membrane protein